MPTAYSGAEILEIAIQIEVCGEAFYEAAIPLLRDEKTVETFRFLRDEERVHAALFEKMLGQITDLAAEWRQDESYQTYLRALAENRVFPSPDAARAAVDELTDDRAAVRYALGFEKDTVLFFHEIRSAVRERDQKIVDRLIQEEQNHIRKLNGLLANLPTHGESRS